MPLFVFAAHPFVIREADRAGLMSAGFPAGAEPRSHRSLMNDWYLYAPPAPGTPPCRRLAHPRATPALQPRSHVRATAAAMAVGVASLGLGSAVRSEVWRDEFRLWRDAAAKSPHSHLARYNLGTIWLERGRLDEAEAELHASMRADPMRPAPYKNLGVLYYRQKRFGLAAALFRTGIRLAPGNYDLWMSLSAAEAGAGREWPGLAAPPDRSQKPPYYVRGSAGARGRGGAAVSRCFSWRRERRLDAGQPKNIFGTSNHENVTLRRAIRVAHSLQLCVWRTLLNARCVPRNQR
jgi:tetratricopeptide (TPR) repeat protein